MANVELRGGVGRPQSNTAPFPRLLKIEATGDFYYGHVRPQIRLSGRWLERAGFKPGHRVQVEWIEDGVLSLRVIEIANSTE
jgi:hypothetical protein